MQNIKITLLLVAVTAFTATATSPGDSTARHRTLRPVEVMGVKQDATLFTRLFEENGVNAVVFGHLHGAAYYPLRSEKNGVRYYLTSCDKTKFSLTEIG